jgi:hypothetical protein
MGRGMLLLLQLELEKQRTRLRHRASGTAAGNMLASPYSPALNDHLLLPRLLEHWCPFSLAHARTGTAVPAAAAAAAVDAAADADAVDAHPAGAAAERAAYTYLFGEHLCCC